MASSLTVRNLSSTPVSIKRIERFEDPNTLQSKAGGYFFSSRNATSAAPTSPELSGHAQSFNHQDLDIALAPFESYTISHADPGRIQDFTNLSRTTLRLTISTPENERHRIDTHPSYTQKTTLSFTPLTPNSSTTYKALFHPSTLLPHLTIHTNHLPNYSSWMATLPDTLPLSALSIPGTHNSHTHYRALPSVRCQVVDVATQLEHGIRFLDIRVQPVHATDASKKDLYLVHGAFPVSLTGPKYFEPVLDMCYAFLARNPSESIIVSLKREGVGSGTDEHVARILDEWYIGPEKEKWWTGTTIPYLGHVRGKLVLVRRYNDAASSPSSPGNQSGLDATAWPQNATHALFPTPAHAPTFCIQDFYEVMVPSHIPTKIQHCNHHLVRAAECEHPIPGLTTDATNPVPPGPLYLNFLSGSNFWKRACWPENIAKIVNRGMEEWVCAEHHLEVTGTPTTRHADTRKEVDGEEVIVRRAKSGDGSTGVVVMDCVGEGGDWEFVRLVIGMNMGVLKEFKV
ncbi:1-phosphatidylinositol phosphodiesterase precursor [Clathrospora elynae]|uniref:1-phosphatidylinositol phosphodiesterase n=1 Tax=Clathrospora elynae TaxID=706981 RepID=A0A6A5SNV9_9PLEO|nr:1-phosphatidylinositol phosphodiesterase precursor [Clathrospora elynae]